MVREYSDMGKRLIATMARVKIYRDSDWNEYSVVPRRGSAAYIDRCSYHTSDKEDAFGTAAVMDKELIDEDDPAYRGPES